MSITVIGSANADLVIEVDRRPSGGETLLGSDLVITPGGKGANQAVAAGLIGGDVTFVGCVGADGNGALLRESLEASGVDTSPVDDVDVPTGCALITITPDGENSIVVSPGANRRVTPEYLDEHADAWTHADLVVLQHEIPLESVRHVAARCRDEGVRFLLNAAPAADVPDDVLAVCDPLVVNEYEAALVAGVTEGSAEPLELARQLLGRGARSVVVTLGSQGSLAVDASGEVTTQEAERVTAVDTTGAGDAFVGAMAVALASGKGFGDALALGTRVAARAVQKRGAQASYPTLADVEAAR